MPPPGQIALRRAIRRRHVCTVDAHRVECRLWALAAWAFPDLWRATGGHTVAQPLLARWPHLESLSRARLGSITDIVAAHSRDNCPEKRAERIRDAAAGWATFWTRRLDLDGLSWELAEMLADINTADRRHRNVPPTRHWGCGQQHWPDDVLTSIPGLGPICASTIRGWWGRRHPPPLGQSSHRSRRAEPIDVVLRAHRSPIEADHQTRTGRATPRPLPSRQRCPAP